MDVGGIKRSTDSRGGRSSREGGDGAIEIAMKKRGPHKGINSSGDSIRGNKNHYKGNTQRSRLRIENLKGHGKGSSRKSKKNIRKVGEDGPKKSDLAKGRICNNLRAEGNEPNKRKPSGCGREERKVQKPGNGRKRGREGRASRK